MAKSNTTQFNIQVGRAVKAVQDLTANVKTYNITVKDGTKAQTASTTQAGKAIRTYDTLNKAISRSTLAQGQYNRRVDAGALSILKMSNAVKDVTTAFQRNAAAVSASTNRVNQETTQVVRSTSALRQFTVGIQQAIASMRTKNSVLGSQTKAIQSEEKQVKNLTLSWQTITRVFLIQEFHRAVSLFTTGLREAIKNATELSIRVSEIQTIQGNAAITSEKWTKDLRELSDAFGLPILEVTEAAYDAISNQIVKATDTARFLKEEIKLSVTTVSELSQAVNTTSTIINAFNLNISETETINAKLFKGVEVGRFRLEELGSSFGRASFIGAQLGVTVDELIAGLSLLTRKGIDVETASTLLVNVFNGLLKPTKQMSGFLGELGVNSGQAAVKTFGFGEVLGKLGAKVDSTGDSLSELSSLFGDIRGFAGAAGLTGIFGEFDTDLKKIQNSLGDFRKAVNITMTSTGRKVKIETEQIKNSFLTTFGQPIIENFIRFAEAVGGARNAFDTLFVTIRRVATAFLVYKGLVLATSNSFIGLNSQVLIGRNGLLIYDSVLKKVTATYSFASIAQGAFLLGLTLLITALIDAKIQVANYGAELEAATLETKRLIEETGEARLKRNIDVLNNSFKDFDESVNGSIKALRIFLANTQAQNNLITENYAKTFKAIKKNAEDTFSDITKTTERAFKAESKLIDDLREKAEKTRELSKTLGIKEADRKFDKGLEGKTEIEKLKALEAEKIKLHSAALLAITKDDEEAAKISFDRSLELAEEQAKIIIELRKKALEDAEKDEISITKTAFVTNPKTGRVQKLTSKNKVLDPAADEASTRAKDLLKELNTLEARRGLLVAERIAAEKDFADRQEAAAKKREVEIKKREDDFEKLKVLIEELQSGKLTPGDFVKKSGEAVGLAKASGLSLDEQLKLFKELKAQEVVLFKQAEVEKTRIALEEQRKRIEIVNKTIQDAENKVKAAGAGKETNVNTTIVNAKKLLEDLRKFQTDTKFINPNEIQIFGAVESASQKEFDKLLQDLNNNLSKLEAAKPGQNIAADLEQLFKTLTKFEEFSAKQKDPIGFNNLLRDLVANKDTFTAKNGKFALAPGGTPLIDDIKKIQQAAIEATQAQQKLNQANAELSKLGPIIKQLNAEASLVPRLELEAAKAAEDWAKRSDDATQIIQSGLNGIIGQLITIRKLQDGLTPVGGPAPAKAFGGSSRGIDRQLAFLAPGEIIMTQSVSKMFGPFLNALNGSNFGNKAFGGSVTFGDIHLNVPQGSTDVQVMAIASGLQRLARRGLFSI